jgi:hypothetical protein
MRIERNLFLIWARIDHVKSNLSLLLTCTFLTRTRTTEPRNQSWTGELRRISVRSTCAEHLHCSLELNIHQQILSDLAFHARQTKDDLLHAKDLISSRVETKEDLKSDELVNGDAGGTETKVFMVCRLPIPDLHLCSHPSLASIDGTL